MPAKPTTAMVLAAGLGTRIAAASNGLPKPLVPLGGKALIDHVLDRHVQAGIQRAIVNVHHKADLIEAHLKGRRAPKIEISDERDSLLDTGGGVKRALPRLGQGPILIHNSDSVWIEGVGSNLARLYQAWSENCMDCLMLLALTSQSLGYHGLGDFAFEADGRIRRRAEQEIVPFAFAGVSLAHPRLLEGSPDGAFSLNRAWDEAIARGRAFGVRLEGTWMHVGTPHALVQAEQLLARTSMH
jgi:MurNAc alpha-1-phosphate uridylyltransferase